MYNSEFISNIENVSHNFINQNNIFLFDEFTTEKCSYMLSDLVSIINSTQYNEINVYINSPGGEINTLLAFLSLFKIAQNSNMNINTIVMGLASSCASLLAICGNKRYMYNKALHFVHFGSITTEVSKSSEIEKSKFILKRHEDIIKSTYLENTKISNDKLNKLIEDEYGYLNSKQCKTLGFCDIII